MTGRSSGTGDLRVVLTNSGECCGSFRRDGGVLDTCELEARVKSGVGYGVHWVQTSI